MSGFPSTERDFETMLRFKAEAGVVPLAEWTRELWRRFRERETARRRAERSTIYNMLESFPRDWNCNPDAVRKWMTAWYKNADDLCEGGLYAE